MLIRTFGKAEDEKFNRIFNGLRFLEGKIQIGFVVEKKEHAIDVQGRQTDSKREENKGLKNVSFVIVSITVTEFMGMHINMRL